MALIDDMAEYLKDIAAIPGGWRSAALEGLLARYDNGEPAENSLTFERVREANASRTRRWHPGFPDDADWTGADWSNAMCGEAGELANVVKKIRRFECGLNGALDPSNDELMAMLAHECADVFLYMQLLAEFYGIDLPAAIVEKFNIVSERQGFPERLA